MDGGNRSMPVYRLAAVPNFTQAWAARCHTQQPICTTFAEHSAAQWANRRPRPADSTARHRVPRSAAARPNWPAANSIHRAPALLPKKTVRPAVIATAQVDTPTFPARDSAAHDSAVHDEPNHFRRS